MKATLFLAWSLAIPSWADTISVQKDVPIGGADAAKATVFSVPLQSARVVVVPALQLRGAKTGSPEVAVSVQDLAQKQAQYRPQIRRSADADYLLINGGFSTEQLGRPAGLLVADGKVLSIPSYSRVRGDQQNDCAFRKKDHFRLSAQLCVPKTGGLEIGYFSASGFEGCRYAIQAGPILIDAGTVAVCKPAFGEVAYKRTALCLSGGEAYKRELKVVVTQSRVTLFDLANWMQSRTDRGGLGCETAMNLGGDDSSGAALFLRNHGIQPDTPWLTVGEGTYPQASFIAISAR